MKVEVALDFVAVLILCSTLFFPIFLHPAGASPSVQTKSTESPPALRTCSADKTCTDLLAAEPSPAKATTEATKADSLDSLSFLSGTWAGKSESGAYVEEYWSKVKDDSIVGHCRFIKDGKTTFYELLSVVKTPAGIVLRMKHLNGEFVPWSDDEESGDCEITEIVAGKEVVFDNKKKEHNVKVKYKKSAGGLSVVVEDTLGDKVSRYPFEYKRING